MPDGGAATTDSTGSSIGALLRFFERCYHADNRETSLLDIFARRVEFRQFLAGTQDLLQGDYPQMPVAANPEHITAIGQIARYQRTEKALLLAAVLVIGRCTDEEGKAHRLCAPVFLLPAHIESNEYAPMLRVELERSRVNYPLLQALGDQHDLDAEQVQDLAEELPAPPWHLGHLSRIADLLETSFLGLDASGLRLFPRQEDEKNIERWRRSKALRAIVATPLVLLPRSPDTRGVLTELHRLSSTGDGGGPTPELSAPLRLLLRDETAGAASRPPSASSHEAAFEEHVPALLSDAQHRVLVNSVRQPLSVVIGPPGTGKSFTIAAIALEAVYRGESVLVAAQRDQAVDVVADKIEQLGGPHELILRTGRSEYRRQLRQTLRQLQRGVLPFPPLPLNARQAKERERDDLRRRLQQREQELTGRSEREQRWGRWQVEAENAPWWQRWPRRTATWTLGQTLTGPLATPYWQLMDGYQQLTERYLEVTLELLRDAFVQRLERHRPLVAQLDKVLRTVVESLRRERFDQLDSETLFRVFPIWMCRLANLNLTLPMHPEMVDLLILDEATQCDIASCLPAFQRARRVVVVGDPEQLRHLSFLSRHRQEGIARELGLEPRTVERFDYARHSILDLAEDQLDGQAGVFLDEHFRSTPEIIGFSNQNIYGGTLKVMRERPPLREPESAQAESTQAESTQPALELRRVEGRREDSGANPAEAEALVEALLSLVRPAEPLRASIGVLSPFRAQVDLLSELLSRRLTPDEQERHDLLVGTPYAFQGEERDVMLLSLVVDDAVHAGSLRFLARRDVLNVAVTRARNRQIVFSSLTAGGARRLPDLLRAYLRYLEAPPVPPVVATSSPHATTGAWRQETFLHQVSRALHERGWQVWPAQPIAGFTVDLVVRRGTTTLGLDLVGHPGRYAGSFATERYRLFRRAGLHILPLPCSAWVRSPEACLEAVERVGRLASG